MVCFTMHENGIRWKLRTHSSGGNVWTTVKCRNENYYFLWLAICIYLSIFEAIEPVLLFHFSLLQNEWNVLLSNKSTLWIKFSQGTFAVCALLVMNSWQRHRCSWPNTSGIQTPKLPSAQTNRICPHHVICIYKRDTLIKALWSCAGTFIFLS